LLAPLNSQICVVLVAEVGPSVILQSVVRPVVIPQSPGQVLQTKCSNRAVFTLRCRSSNRFVRV